MARVSYNPLYDEVAGIFKIFFIAWFLWFILLFIVLGINYWAFWGALGLGLIFALITTIVLFVATGVNEQINK